MTHWRHSKVGQERYTALFVADTTPGLQPFNKYHNVGEPGRDRNRVQHQRRGPACSGNRVSAECSSIRPAGKRVAVQESDMETRPKHWLHGSSQWFELAPSSSRLAISILDSNCAALTHEASDEASEPVRCCNELDGVFN
ncbi:hypothetical protein RRG08_045350 [Elysia crispata]|uniref:Uncharacterized protein n=1 Tax=Elysia crispata TaxID=231223 RepID=A0AAE1A200_9GAST|nr:hypothetical protein RRG08_045350 [Elysia crispata]